MVVQAVVVEEIHQMLVDQEIYHQFHHHKEIMVEMEFLVEAAVVAVEAAQLAQLQLFLLEEMVEMELHLQSQAQQLHTLVVEVEAVKMVLVLVALADLVAAALVQLQLVVVLVQQELLERQILVVAAAEVAIMDPRAFLVAQVVLIL